MAQSPAPQGSAPRVLAPDAAPRGALSGWPLRRILVVSILLMFAVVTATSGLVMSSLFQRGLEAELDARVQSSAVRAVRPLDGDDHGPHDGRPTGRRPIGDTLLLVVSGSSVVENYAPGTSATTLNAQQVSALAAAGLDEHPRTVDLGPGLGTYRMVGSHTPDGRLVITGQPMEPMLENLHRIRLVTLLATSLGFVVVGIATTIIVRRALRPLDEVAATATRVSLLPLTEADAHVRERVPAVHTDRRTEVGQVGAALNDLLRHVDTSLQSRAESERRLRQFVADASHELRTPLATIRGYTELSLRDVALPEEVRRSLHRVASESGRMASLVDDLLLLARLDAGRPLEKAPVDLTMLLMETVDDARVAGPDHHWRLDLPEEAVEVPGDRARLTQVVVNLLANARRHTPPGTTVTASLRSEPDRAVIAVEDDGPGISADLLPTIFERFSRGDTARTRTGGSTGLGLSIVAAVLEAHGGRVTVDSRPGNTRFTAVLPR